MLKNGTQAPILRIIGDVDNSLAVLDQDEGENHDCPIGLREPGPRLWTLRTALRSRLVAARMRSLHIQMFKFGMVGIVGRVHS